LNVFWVLSLSEQSATVIAKVPGCSFGDGDIAAENAFAVKTHH
jgi:hypothetical protein